MEGFNDKPVIQNVLFFKLIIDIKYIERSRVGLDIPFLVVITNYGHWTNALDYYSNIFRYAVEWKADEENSLFVPDIDDKTKSLLTYDGDLTSVFNNSNFTGKAIELKDGMQECRFVITTENKSKIVGHMGGIQLLEMEPNSMMPTEDKPSCNAKMQSESSSANTKPTEDKHFRAKMPVGDKLSRAKQSFLSIAKKKLEKHLTYQLL